MTNTYHNIQLRLKKDYGGDWIVYPMDTIYYIRKDGWALDIPMIDSYQEDELYTYILNHILIHNPEFLL